MMTRTGYQKEIEKNQLAVRDLVMQGYDQAMQGKVKDFEEVCDRLEKKYADEKI